MLATVADHIVRNSLQQVGIGRIALVSGLGRSDGFIAGEEVPDPFLIRNLDQCMAGPMSGISR